MKMMDSKARSPIMPECIEGAWWRSLWASQGGSGGVHGGNGCNNKDKKVQNQSGTHHLAKAASSGMATRREQHDKKLGKCMTNG